MLNNVSFQLGKGGLGRPLPGQDYISGLVFYSSALPSGFGVSDRIKQFFSVEDAETAGILDDYSDATAAAATFAVDTIGTTGDSVSLKVNEIDELGVARAVELALYTKTGTETTAALVAAAIVALINAGTLDHGYTAAVANTDEVAITAPKRLGVFLNSGSPLTATYSDGAALAGTITQFTGGAASRNAVMHYHISEFFRLQPQGVLYVGIFAVPSPSYTFEEITTMQTFANGAIRQIGVFKDSAAFAGGDLTLIHNVCAANVANHKELVALYGADISGTANVSALANLSLLTANYVSPVIGQDGAARGNYLFKTFGKSITCLGAALGAVAFAKVSQSIAWVANFNISDGVECDVPAFANGVLLSSSSVSDNLLVQLQNYCYLFLRKFVGVAGSYFNENRTAISASSDYAFITDNRVIQKATRGIYTNLVPALNGPVYLNADGTLQDESIAYYTGLAETSLLQMIRDGELSAQQVTIDPRQNILSTGTLFITVKLVQVATARNIIVKIGYAVSI